MKKIRINRKKWARADGDDYEGRLWNADEGVGCCLGHLIHQVSKCSWDKLDGLITPDDFYTRKGILTVMFPESDMLPESDPISFYYNRKKVIDNNEFSDQAMSINDNEGLSGKQRERKLISLFYQNDFELEFYN